MENNTKRKTIKKYNYGQESINIVVISSLILGFASLIIFVRGIELKSSYISIVGGLGILVCYHNFCKAFLTPKEIIEIEETIE